MNAAGKEPDAQAAFEIGTHTLMAALAGARAFRTAGTLSCCEIYSAEMLVIIDEIMEYIRTVLKPEEFSDDRLMVDEIRAVGPGESYIGRDSTRERYRSEYWIPELFDHSNLGQWREAGSMSIEKRANEIAKQKIREHTYRIDDAVKKELDRIYARARDDDKLIDSFR
jgi:trimethylamine---corrinoid protein Co-methyltransferase